MRLTPGLSSQSNFIFGLRRDAASSGIVEQQVGVQCGGHILASHRCKWCCCSRLHGFLSTNHMLPESKRFLWWCSHMPYSAWPWAVGSYLGCLLWCCATPLTGKVQWSIHADGPNVLSRVTSASQLCQYIISCGTELPFGSELCLISAIVQTKHRK